MELRTLLVAFIALFSSLTNFFLAFLVWSRNRKSKVNVSLSVFALTTGLWIFSNFILRLTTNYILLRLTFSLGAIVAVAAIYWVISFKGKVSIYDRVLEIFITILGVIFAILPFMGDLIVVGTLESTDPFAPFKRGILFDYYAFFTALAILIPLFLLVNSYRDAVSMKRMQYKFILFGLSIFGVSSLILSLVLPSFGIEKYSSLDSLFSLFFVGFSAYAIVKYRFLDIRAVVARSVTYAILIVILAGLYSGSLISMEYLLFPDHIDSFNLMQSILRTVLAVVMVFLFQPIKNWITKVTDSVFFRGRYNANELLSELSNTMNSTIVLVELSYRVSALIQKNIKATRVLIALVKDETRMYSVQATGYKQTPDVDPRDVYYLAKDGIIISDDLEDGARLKRILAEYNATVAIPIKTESEVIGAVLMGEKSSGDMYNQQDMHVLEILGPELAVAVENAKSYEEISKFNVTLRQEIKRATYRLKQKNTELMELDKAKDEFISMASHQLRTPLTAIKGYLSMLLEGDAGDIKVSQYDFINEAYSGANRMVGLINDLLNVSRMETGRFFLEPKEMDIERVVAEEVKQLEQQAKTRGLYVKVVKKGKVPRIWADETKIRQVVMNFIDNALYYTATGGVTIVLRHDKDDFFYEVHDTGIGVPEAQKHHLFEKFFRADNARTTRPDGTGLGIYLAKRVIEDHGGEIIFDSVEGKGSMFGFKFPLKKRVESKAVSAPMPKVVNTAETIQAASTAAVDAANAESDKK